MHVLTGAWVLVVWMLSHQLVASTHNHNDIVTNNHNDIVMGVPDDGCDNGQWNLQLDFNESSSLCLEEEQNTNFGSLLPHDVECLSASEIDPPIHHCMDDEITYTDQPPRSGAHRPLWPRYGEYSNLPPQRWVHSLEHGAAVFLYHPCAPASEVQRLRSIAEDCLQKYILAPYKQKLTPEQPFAVITYGCRLRLGWINTEAVAEFIQQHALHAPETQAVKDGQYSARLIKPAVNGPTVTNQVYC